MNYNIFLLIIALFVFSNAFSQTDESKEEAKILNPNLDITVGYVPDANYKAFKTSASVNNILLQRVGFYTSIEIGKSGDYFINIVGTNISVTPKVYTFFGIDLIGKNGLIKTTSGLRKELGIGYLPYKWVVVRAGWSLAVGPTLAAGVKIPF